MVSIIARHFLAAPGSDFLQAAAIGQAARALASWRET
jgi:hypothetical protein